ncbi:type II toxin-antitoxin system HicA family toxin [bacterium]|nr:type II toxin-antitoxin system HicA family toxin [bacterium]
MKKAGFSVDHQKGSHIYLYHPDKIGRFVAAAYHNKTIKPKH